MNIKSKAGVAVTAFGLLYSLAAYMMPRASIGNPVAPIVFPMFLGLGLTIMGAAYFIREFNIWKIKEKNGEIAPPNPAKVEIERKTNKLILITSLSGIGYALLFEHLGYVLSTTLFLGSIMYALNGKSKWKLNIAVAVVFSVVVYFLFSNLLAIPLPRMIFLDI